MTYRLAIICSLALTLAACGGDGTEDDGGGGAADTAVDDGATEGGTDDDVSASDTAAGDTAADDTDEASGAATLVWGKAGDLADSDPHVSGDAASWEILYLAYESLVEMGDDLDPQPGLAESWEQPEPTVWEFTLRDGVAFSNGRPMSVDDVVGSLERMIDPELGSPWVAQVGEITSIEAVDDSTVRIELAQPNSKFLAAMAHVNASIVPMEELEAGDFDPATDIVGTGPYMPVEHLLDEKWVFEANPHYWGGSIGFPDLEVLIIPDDAARIAAMQDGRVDISTFENPDTELLLAGADGVEVSRLLTTDYYVLHLNNVNPESAVLDDELRLAINAAIDRDRIAEIAMGGVAEVTAVTPIGLEGACDPTTVPSATMSTDEAAAIIEERAPDLQLELVSTATIARLPEIAQVIQEDLADVGLDVEISELEIGAWSERIYVAEPSDFDAALSFYAGYAEATMLPLWWDVERAGWTQDMLAPNEELATEIRAAEASELGSDEYVEHLVNVCQLADEDAAMIPLVTKPIMVAVDTDDVRAQIHTREGYSDVFRFIPDYTPA